MAAPLSDANVTFYLALYQKLGQHDKNANIFFSPFSISSALAMVLLGARGNTATQMSQVLGFIPKLPPTEGAVLEGAEPPEQKTAISRPPNLQRSLCFNKSLAGVHVAFSRLISELNKPDTPYDLSTANRLFGEKSFDFVKDFLESTNTFYKAELEAVDFQNKAEEVRVIINTWVEKQTQDKIKDLVKPGMLGSMTKLVLVNAIYFKGTWADKFSKDDTNDSEFRMTKNDSKTVKMMHQRSKFNISSISECNCQVLEMPYTKNGLSMIVILPKDIEDDTTGLEKLESMLTAEKFQEWTKPELMQNVEVEVALPRFRLEQEIELKEVLTSMGMVDLFDPTLCDLTGISTAKSLVVSKVIHKAFVEVDEEGTEAAAATGVLIELTSANLGPPENFTADHPFLFFIRHNSTKTILFSGRVTNPE